MPRRTPTRPSGSPSSAPQDGEARSDAPGGCRVYVVELDREVLKERAFVVENPRYVRGRLCLYVGSTCLSPEERFENHMRGHRGNRYVYRYGVRLRPDFYRHYPPMPRDLAELTEREVALELRAEGYGVWFNV